jgi:hypothetical protein
MAYKVDGHSFTTEDEKERYLALKMMKANNEIRDFKVVVKPCVLVKGFHKCENCGTLSCTSRCDRCGSKAYFSTGIQYRPSFIVHELDGRFVVEDVMKSLQMSHVWNLKKVLYDLTYTVPVYVIVRGKRYHKTTSGWVVSA